MLEVEKKRRNFDESLWSYEKKSHTCTCLLFFELQSAILPVQALTTSRQDYSRTRRHRHYPCRQPLSDNSTKMMLRHTFYYSLLNWFRPFICISVSSSVPRADNVLMFSWAKQTNFIIWRWQSSWSEKKKSRWLPTLFLRKAVNSPYSKVARQDWMTPKKELLGCHHTAASSCLAEKGIWIMRLFTEDVQVHDWLNPFEQMLMK